MAWKSHCRTIGKRMDQGIFHNSNSIGWQHLWCASTSLFQWLMWIERYDIRGVILESIYSTVIYPAFWPYITSLLSIQCIMDTPWRTIWIECCNQILHLINIYSSSMPNQIFSAWWNYSRNYQEKFVISPFSPSSLSKSLLFYLSCCTHLIIPIPSPNIPATDNKYVFFIF